MVKLDISTSQIVWHKGEQAVIRRISKDGQTITLSLESGCIANVTPKELLKDNPDIVYSMDEEEKKYVGDDDAESDPYGLMKWVREDEERGEFDD